MAGDSSHLGCAKGQLGPCGQNPVMKSGHAVILTCLFLQLGPCLQKPLAYQTHSFTLLLGSMWRYMHSGLEHSPYLLKNQHSGIFFKLYSCKNSQFSPFLHSPRSQCLHTTDLSGRPCLKAQEEPLVQLPLRKKRQMLRVAGSESVNFLKSKLIPRRSRTKPSNSKLRSSQLNDMTGREVGLVVVLGYRAGGLVKL